MATTSLTPTNSAPGGMAGKLIAHFKMQRIPMEGPWFNLTYTNTDILSSESLPPRYHGTRATSSAICALETRVDFSALHKLKTDEIWHFYGGDPIEMLLLYPDGHGEIVIIGPDALGGQHPQFTVPRSVWQGSRPLRDLPDAYSLFGNTLSPGFDYQDCEIGYRDELQKQYPHFAALIEQLTRPEFASRVDSCLSE